MLPFREGRATNQSLNNAIVQTAALKLLQAITRKMLFNVTAGSNSY